MWKAHLDSPQIEAHRRPIRATQIDGKICTWNSKMEELLRGVLAIKWRSRGRVNVKTGDGERSLFERVCVSVKENN